MLTAIAHYSIYYGGLIRGYETSWLTAGRNLGLLSLLAILPIVLKKFGKYQGSWTIYTAAVLAVFARTCRAVSSFQRSGIHFPQR